MKIKLKWILITVVAMMTILAMTGVAQATDVYLGGDRMHFDQAPANVNGRILVPMRAIFGAFGADITWDPGSQSVTANVPGTTVQLNIDSRMAYVNGRAVTLDVPAQIVNGRTMVPLRFVSESLGCQVDYTADTDTVHIIINNSAASTGEYRWANGDRYQGELVQGLPNGYGAWAFATPAADNGWWTAYQGYFKDAEMNGLGTLYIGDDGTMLEGNWKANQPVDYMVYSAPEGNVSGIWHYELRNGKHFAVCENGYAIQYWYPGEH